MRIGGFQKLSLVDYPGKLCAIIWTVGCNFRCKFCYDPGLVLPEKMREIKEVPRDYIFSYLEKRRNFLDAVEITGGEPTLHEDLPEFIEEIKEIGYLVKLDTNGTNPSMLQYLMDSNLIDYVAMDIKTKLAFERYNEIVGNVLTQEMFENVKSSIKILLNSKIDCEFRTTLVKNFHSKEDVIEVCKSVRGAEAYYLQNLRVVDEFVGGGELAPLDEEEIEEIVSEGRKVVNIAYRKG
ncbi:MAG: anaerobic ribonucleoside-triphosphate reductase activating protein [Candidatus Bathyarchaeota archaeon]|nr:anaerobic ribonucleoside-triphosphate reductase activating protein [Candidatus Bathyarchaeota archaeon]